MENEPIEAKPTRTSFVYDSRTGKVVHIHQYVPLHPGEKCAEAEMERTALQLAPSHFDRGHLAVLHFEGDKYSDPSIRYRVDCEKRTLIAESALSSVSSGIAFDASTVQTLKKRPQPEPECGGGATGSKQGHCPNK